MFNICCEPFGRDLALAGKQGLSVIALIFGALRRFQLQARPFTQAQEAALIVAAREQEPSIVHIMRADGHSTPIKTVITMTLLFCPYCGQDLQKLVDDQIEAFDALAQTHKEWTLI